nr:MAG TPA: hypothetical protein [Caudoviricetes sp.]
MAAFGEIAHNIRPLTANRQSCYNTYNTVRTKLSRGKFIFFALDFRFDSALYSHQRRPRGTHGGIVGAADAKKIAIICSQITPDQRRKVWLFMCLIWLYILYINRLPVHYCMLISFIIPP